MRAKRSVAFSQRVLWKQLQMEMFTFFKQREREKNPETAEEILYYTTVLTYTRVCMASRVFFSTFILGHGYGGGCRHPSSRHPNPSLPFCSPLFRSISCKRRPSNLRSIEKKKKFFFFFVTFSGELDDGFVLLGLVCIWGFLGFRGLLSVWAIFVDLTLLCFSHCGK